MNQHNQETWPCSGPREKPPMQWRIRTRTGIMMAPVVPQRRRRHLQEVLTFLASSVRRRRVPVLALAAAKEEDRQMTRHNKWMMTVPSRSAGEHDFVSSTWCLRPRSSSGCEYGSALAAPLSAPRQASPPAKGLGAPGISRLMRAGTMMAPRPGPRSPPCASAGLARQKGSPRRPKSSD